MEFITTSDCPEYLKKAEKRIMEEIDRVNNYLDPSSEPKITKVVEMELVEKQAGPKPTFHRKLGLWGG